MQAKVTLTLGGLGREGEVRKGPALHPQGQSQSEQRRLTDISSSCLDSPALKTQKQGSICQLHQLLSCFPYGKAQS